MQDQDPQGYPKLDIKAARALNSRIQAIRIESILGGFSPTTHFGQPSQYRKAYGIDPSLPINDSTSINIGTGLTKISVVASGLLRPSPNSTIASNLNQTPLWMIKNPKDSNVYVYDFQGSAYSITALNVVTGLSDAGSLSSSTGNGIAYYDNYIYFAKNTDIARYGPLNGVPIFDGTYWTSTLSKAALTNTAYPTSNYVANITHPNHILHRHSDGKLYIGDVVGNQGTIHYISTTKSTVEGDTDNGSTFSKLIFGYGLWPTAIESYGSSLAIALSEFTTGVGERAKLALWDTTSQNFNQITWVEFPDTFISAMKNVDGVLYIISNNAGNTGFRVSRYVGGYTVEDVSYIEAGSIPLPGAVDGDSGRLLFGSKSALNLAGTIFSLGLQKQALGKGLHGVLRPVADVATKMPSCILLRGTSFGYSLPYVGYGDGAASSASHNLIDAPVTGTYSSTSLWWSQTYRIGMPFKIVSIRIPMAQAIAAGMSVTPTIYTDDGIASTALVTIDNTSYPGQNHIIIRPSGLTGNHNFWLELSWTGSTLCVVGLPITIEYEVIPD